MSAQKKFWLKLRPKQDYLVLAEAGPSTTALRCKYNNLQICVANSTIYSTAFYVNIITIPKLRLVCSDVCQRTAHNQYKCTCRHGRVLSPDGKTCSTDVHVPAIYLASNTFLTRLIIDNIGSDSFEKINNIRFNGLTSLSFDPITYSIYFSDTSLNENLPNVDDMFGQHNSIVNPEHENNELINNNRDDNMDDVIGLVHLETLVM
ncbi:hypothetical protein HELRODRAFT_165050 [Helobdella robusta]|uniref:EGF-like domain-containing protein n=1 Tax=Helobdella robusta TaxID=6412 RepID=T1EW73_HELRO|nr:hypothetical protein HELRODRAFT_165050 [Helobdella robusta]ESN92914.1 hypothetical protein HELRODRAFT_165050 [Helobdella robusta]